MKGPKLIEADKCKCRDEEFIKGDAVTLCRECGGFKKTSEGEFADGWVE